MPTTIATKRSRGLRRWLDHVALRIRQGTAETASETAGLARQLAPKRTGTMASTVEYKPDGSVSAGGAAAPYTMFVHFGTRKVAARPFLSLAFAAFKGRFLARMKAAITGR